jgi:hypothetical protein
LADRRLDAAVHGPCILTSGVIVLRPNNLEEIGMKAVAVQKLVAQRTGTKGEDRERLNLEVRRAKNSLLVAIRSWRRRNEG